MPHALLHPHVVACHRKQAHTSEAAAWTVILAMRRKGRDTTRLQPYQCTHCNAWHLGNRLPRLRLVLGSVKPRQQEQESN